MKSIKKIEEILKQRGETHGHHEDVLTKIAEYWGNYLNMEINYLDVAKMMVLLKISRAQFGSEWNTDDYLDMAGYALLGAEICIDDEELREEIEKDADERLLPNFSEVVNLRVATTIGEATKVIEIPNATISEWRDELDGTKSYTFTSGGASQETYFGYERPFGEG